MGCMHIYMTVCLNVNNILPYLPEFHIGIRSKKKNKQILLLPIYSFFSWFKRRCLTALPTSSRFI